jgi:hypothetical protein
MKLVHASIPADDPADAARVLSDIMGGEAVRFPPGGPKAWMAWSGDQKVTLEVVPRGRLIHYEEEGGNWRSPGPDIQRHSEVHLAISVENPADRVIEIANQAGWPARRCSRGNGFFELVEVWVDGSFMIEILDPEQTAHYEKVITLDAWKAMVKQMEAA